MMTLHNVVHLLEITEQSTKNKNKDNRIGKRYRQLKATLVSKDTRGRGRSKRG